ncbi:GNAT family N-acetyltransferase [Micrococcus sp.]|uniref:GNAT family N-acetyltransferase n=1 Tax=Micrococcus sp. TaxID=1271 RepID=UPI0026DCED0E|nr:GNAT family N-acetyltransferase [Micrococcus sp.]MDO4238970.1 GNAT family N-acetyltransferase [Micrococcus sp.]
MTQTIDDIQVGTWFAAWSRSRGYETRTEDGVRSALRQRRPARRIPGGSGRATLDIPTTWEHILVEPGEAELAPVLEQLGEHPDRLVTVFGEPVQDLTAAGLHSAAEPERFMSVTLDPEVQDVEPPILPEGYEARVDEPVEGSRRLRLYASGHASTAPEGEDELAAVGWVTFEDSTAVFDRIWTSPQHRRRGLGSIVMRHLTSEALSTGRDLEEGLLVASPDGQKLYGHLGWTDLGPVSIWTRADGEQPGAEHTGTMGR